MLIHKPVLVNEVIDALKIEDFAHSKKIKRIIDATVGTGGHTIGILGYGLKVLGIDADEEMLEIARENINNACPAAFKDKDGLCTLILGNFKDIDTIAKENGFSSVDGILFDFGINSLQIDDPDRGFSYKNPDADLDMRLAPKAQEVTGGMLLNSLRQDQLEEMFRVTLSYTSAVDLAKRVVNERGVKKFEKVGDFTNVIEGLYPKIKSDKIHFATLPFMALRIAVNSELDNIRQALPKAFDLLNRNGRICFISFHSGEDKIVKEFIRDYLNRKLALSLTKSPIKPEISEVENNSRARSAKLRIIEKI